MIGHDGITNDIMPTLLKVIKPIVLTILTIAYFTVPIGTGKRDGVNTNAVGYLFFKWYKSLVYSFGAYTKLRTFF